MPPEILLTPDEVNIVDLLGEAFNNFVDLEELHPSDRAEFAQAIHNAQNIVMSRPVIRAQKQAANEI